MIRSCLASVLVLGVIGTLACGRPSPRGPDVYGYRVRSAEVDPYIVERAPRTYYRGGWAHLVDGRWHYRTETGWVVFEETPPELARVTDSVGTEQSATDLPSPRGPTINQFPGGASGALALPPPKVR